MFKLIAFSLAGAVAGGVAATVVVGVLMMIVVGGYFVAGSIGPVEWPEHVTPTKLEQSLAVSVYFGAIIGGVIAALNFHKF